MQDASKPGRLSYEVELKFAAIDADAVRAKLDALGAVAESPLRQVDVYFQHPSRDFARTDEALRIRNVVGRSWVTYKGPKIDASTKTRREIELTIGSRTGDGGRMAELLRLLGFRESGTVCKSRRPFCVAWEGRRCEVAIDEVDGLGTFAEFETCADESNLEAARASLLRLAADFGFAESERRSYLQLLLEKGEA